MQTKKNSLIESITNTIQQPKQLNYERNNERQ